MVKPANSQAQAAAAKPATQASALHSLRLLAVLLPSYVDGLRASLSLETTGDPRSATSAAPQGCVGQGMGGTPMSPGVQPVPAENAPTASTTAQGIVTRMGQDLQGLGGAAIEPGPEGMRPASSGFGACAGASGARAAATPAGQACAARAGAAALHAPPSNTGVNKIGSGHGV